MFKLGVLTATRWEYHAVRRALHFPDSTGASGRRWCITRNNHIHVALFQTGMGSDGVSRACRSVLDHDRWDLMISTGFAGALEEAHIGDMIIATQACAVREDLSTLEPSFFPCDSHFQNIAVASAKELKMSCLVGPMITVPRVVCQAKEKRRLAEQTWGVGVDMESAEIGRHAHKCSIPFLVVRVISDLVDEDLPLDFNLLQQPLGWVRGFMACLQHPRRFRAIHRFHKQTIVAADHLTRFFHRFLIVMEEEASVRESS